MQCKANQRNERTNERARADKGKAINERASDEGGDPQLHNRILAFSTHRRTLQLARHAHGAFKVILGL